MYPENGYVLDPVGRDERDLLASRYRVLDEIGSGGQATTYRARDEARAAIVALKELRLRHARDWKAVELFEREAEALERLDHPAIPGYVDSFHEEREGGELRFFLVQDYVEGRTLAELLEAGESFDEEDAIEILDQMLAILVYLGEQRPPVIHRDIKPSNIIRRPGGALALVDFGAVQLVASETVGGSTVIGTAGFVAPEQLTGHGAPATDLYALGATILQLLTGRAPDELPRRRLRLDVGASVDVRPGLQRLLEDMLAPALEDRIDDATRARARLERVREGAGALELFTPAMPELGSPGGRLRIWRRDGGSLAVFDSRELERRRQLVDIVAALGVAAFLGLFVAPMFLPISVPSWSFMQLAFVLALAGMVLFFSRFLRETFVFDDRSLRRRIGLTASLSLPLPRSLGGADEIDAIAARSEHGRDGEEGTYTLVVESAGGGVTRPLRGLDREEAEWLEEALRASLPEACFS
jgi:serine/threonine protein kinase